jgi:transcriptional antiterminator NusG
MQDRYGEILVPVEEVVEMKAGQKNISERKFFPGYIMVEMEMSDETWHLVNSTPKVTGFVGGSAMKPTPISTKEVQNILRQIYYMGAIRIHVHLTGELLWQKR